MSGDNSRPPQSGLTRARGPGGGFDAATHASVAGGEVRAARNFDEARAMLLEAAGMAPAPVAKPLRARPLGEAAAWRDGWRAAMACAVLVAETARAPVAVDLLREQLEPPV